MYGKAYCTEGRDSYPFAGSRIKLKAPCPVEGCPNSNRIITWKCKDNGHDLYIRDDGLLECEDRSTGVCGRIDKWRFNCGKHYDFRYPSYERLLDMIFFIRRTEVDKAFLRNLEWALENIEDN